MSRAREVSKISSTLSASVSNLNSEIQNFDAIAYSSASPSGAETGDIWVDTSTANPLIKAYDGTDWDTLGSAPVPIITGIAPDNIAGSASTAVIINGSNFESGSIVKLIDTSNTELFTLSTTFNNSRSLQFLTPALSASAGPYDVKVTNPDNQISILENALTVGTTPTWVTNSGSLGLIYDSARSNTTFTVQATDADNHTITYSIISGSLPTGMTMTNQGVISGTAQAVASDTTYAFTIRAIDTSGATNERSFSITTKAPIVQSFTSGTTNWVSPVSGSIRVLVVAGGGGGGQWDGGGGGAGGVIHNTSYAVTQNQSYNVVVGAGGGGGVAGYIGSGNSLADGVNGSNSSFGALIAVGGGGGGGGYRGGKPGGSGGGGGFNSNSSIAAGGAATAGQGYIGGTGYLQTASHGGGGGGGAAGAGQSGTSAKAGDGGPGVGNDITGTLTYYAGGGGGSVEPSTYPIGAGGIGGGGSGFTYTRINATANTGGGGGAAAAGNSPFPNLNGGDGGSGIVIVRY